MTLAPDKTAGGGPGRFALSRPDYVVMAALLVSVVVFAVTWVARRPWPDNWDAADYAVRCIALADGLRQGLGTFLGRFPGSHGPLMPLLNTAGLLLVPCAGPFAVMASIQMGSMGLAACLLYATLRRVLGRPASVGLVLLYVLSPMHFYWSTQIMHEGPALAALTALLLACCVDRERRSGFSAFGVGAMLGLVTLTRLNLAVPALGAALPYLVWRFRRTPRPAWRRAALALLVPVAATTGVWYGATLWHMLGYARFAYVWPSHAPAGESWLGTQLQYANYLWREWGAVSVALAVGATATALVFLAWRRHRDAFPAGMVAAVFVLILVVLCIAGRQKNERFLLPVLVPGLVLVGYAGQAAARRRAARALLGAALAAALLVQGVAFVGRFEPRLPQGVRLALYGPLEGQRDLFGTSDAAGAALELVSSDVPRGGRVLFVGHGRDFCNAYVRYWNAVRGSALDIDLAWEHLDPDGSAERVAGRIRGSPYVLFYRAGPADGAAYRKCSDVAAATLAALVDGGQADQVWSRAQWQVALYRIQVAPEASSRVGRPAT